MASDDEDVPDTGAVFTFGKTRFADNLASKFWIRDDPVVHISCGDEHSTIVTAKGKLYSFGSNDWGQLGHGNTKPYNKPSVVKKLKPEKSYLVACGRNHTLVATESGRLYSFGCGGDGQLGHDDSEDSHEPKAIDSLNNQRYSLLACGSDFSAAVTDNGVLYTWGCSSEGQNGLGEDTESPKRLYISGKVVSVACGYYHMAVVTDDGSLYTCGESEGGKLGLEKSQQDDTSQLQKVESIKEKVVSVSCGAEFTVAVTQNGHVYSFGQGNQGQLGLGSALTECELPEKVQAFVKVKAKGVGCGESFTAIVTKHGNLYSCGDGRHGKLGLGDECFSNLFKPQKVTRFNNFIVKKVSCGGCHMLVAAVKKEGSVEESDSEEQAEKDTLAATMKGRLLDTVDGPSDFSATWSARDKRRHKNVEDINNSLSHSLPPINKSSLPPLHATLKRTLPALGKSNLNEEEKKPVNPLNISRLPKITHPDDDEDNQTSTPKSQTSPKSSPKPLPRGLGKPLAAPRALPRVKKGKEETEESESEEESEEEEDNERNKKQDKESSKKKEPKKHAKKQEEEESEEVEESESETEEEEEKKDPKQPIINNKKDTTAKESTTKDDDDDSEEESDEEDDDDETQDDDEDDNKNKTKSKVGNKKDSKLKDNKIEVEKRSDKKSGEEEDEESEEDKDAKNKKKKKGSKEADEKEKKNKKNKKKSKDDKEDTETTEQSIENTKTTKKKGKKKKEETEEEDDEEEDKQESKEKTDENIKDEDNKDQESAATTTPKQKEKKSGICVLL